MFSKKLIIIGLGVFLMASVIVGKNWLSRNNLPESVISAQKAPDYTMVFLGDSMTENLGNFDELRGYLKDYYPDKNFLLLNYGFSSTNIV